MFSNDFLLYIPLILYPLGLYVLFMFLRFLYKKAKRLFLHFNWAKSFGENERISYFNIVNGNIVYLIKKDDDSYKLHRAFMNACGKTVVVERATFLADEEIFAESEFNRWVDLYLSRENRIDGSKYTNAIYIE